MNEATAAEQLQQHKWKFYNSTDIGLLNDGNLLRYIDIPHKGHDDLIQFCEKFVDEKNYANDSTIRYAFVAGPWVDNEERSGNWRHVRTFIQRVDNQGRVGPDGTKYRLIQELAEGFLTSLTYAEARLIQSRMTPGDATSEESSPEDAQGDNVFLTLQWVGVDPDTIYTLAAAKNTETVVSDIAHRKIGHNGVVTTVPIAGDWHPLNVDARLAQDGSGTVTWTLGQPTFTLDSFSNYNGAGQQARIYWWNIPEAFADVVVAAYEATGADVTASYDDQNGLVNIIVDQLAFTKVDTGWKVYTSEDGDVGVRTILNADGTTDLPGIITDLETYTSGNRTNLSITPAFGMPGKFNVVASYRPQASEFRISSGNWNSLSTRYYDFPGRTLPNGSYRPRVAVKVSHHSTETNAWTAYTTAIGANVTPALTTPLLIESFGKWAAGIQYLGQNKWRSVRIEEETG